MDVVLTKELESYVVEKVASGLYHSASDVIRDGLRLLKERDDFEQSKLANLRQAIALGVAQADAGQTQPFDEETTTRIKVRGRAQIAARDALDQA